MNQVYLQLLPIFSTWLLELLTAEECFELHIRNSAGMSIAKPQFAKLRIIRFLNGLLFLVLFLKIEDLVKCHYSQSGS